MTNDNTYTLPKGYKLHSPKNVYTIVDTLGSGGFGITYLAEARIHDGKITHKVMYAIKELFMHDINERADDNSVLCSRPSEERMQNSIKDFVSESQRLNHVGTLHDNIIKVNEVFEANNTAYYVMEYIDGMSLRDYVQRRGHLSEDEMLAVMRPIINGVACLHANYITHLDIKPDNIMLRSDDTGDYCPVLIDFGLSKHYKKSGSPTSAVTNLGCSDGYAPPEQYAGIRQFSPSADIYAIGATMFFCLTGKDPRRSTDLYEGELTSGLPAETSEDVKTMIDAAVTLQWHQRPVSFEDIAKREPLNPNREERNTQRITNKIKGPTVKRKWLLIASICLIVMLCLFAVSRLGGPLGKSVTMSSSGGSSSSEVSAAHNGYGYVDLGLPSGLKWATCNVGADSPEDYGDYYAWGETSTKSSYGSGNCETWNKSIGDIKGTSRDVAHVKWGGSWRMPTKAEFEELLNTDNCTGEWTTLNGKKGYKVTSCKNGNSIFLPAAGWRNGKSLDGTDAWGGYWSSTPGESSTQYAYRLYFYSSLHDTSWYYCYYGHTVRPVSE